MDCMDEMGLHYGYEILLRVFGMVCLHGKPNTILHGGCVLSCYGYVLPLGLLDRGLNIFYWLSFVWLGGSMVVFLAVFWLWKMVDRVVDKMGMGGTGYNHQMKEKRR